MYKLVYKQLYKTALGVAVVFVLTVLHILSFYPHQATEPADCVVVFGAAVWPGYFGPVPSDALQDRTLAAAELYKQGLTKDCIVLSGADSIYGAHEVDVMTDILLDNDVPESVIVLDREGVNTLSTIQHLTEALQTKSYILVSNDFHLARIGLLAQRVGLSHGGFELHSAPYTTGGRYSREWYFVFRESVAFWYYFFVTLI